MISIYRMRAPARRPANWVRGLTQVGRCGDSIIPWLQRHRPRQTLIPPHRQANLMPELIPTEAGTGGVGNDSGAGQSTFESVEGPAQGISRKPVGLGADDQREPPG